jgi:hypothetical protein
VLTVFKAISQPFPVLPELRMRKPEPKYFQVQAGTRTAAEARLHPELTCVLSDFYNQFLPPGTAQAEPEPKYFQVQAGTEPQQRPACTLNC